MASRDATFSAWMRDQFQANPGKSQSDLARMLGVNRSVVTKMLKDQRKRGFSLHERQTIEQFFSDMVASDTLRPAGHIGGIVVQGRIGSHIWQLDAHPYSDKRIGSPILDYPIEQQSAFELDASSDDGEFRRGDFVYAVPFEAYRQRPLPGDILVLRRRNGDLSSYLLVRAAMRRGGHIDLRPVLPGNDDTGGELIGLVIGTYRPLSRRN